MKNRVLAIDDELAWLKNFEAWIPSDIAEQDSAATTEDAIGFLRRRRYAVVLLDLSMDLTDSFNRSNRGVQDYLATKPEGTEYIIVSGIVEKAEVRDALRSLNAFDVIFKAKIDPSILRDVVSTAIEKAQAHHAKLVVRDKARLTDSGKLDDSILRAIAPKDGVSGLYRVFDAALARLAPVAPHLNRPRLEVRGRHVLGIAWSRLLGGAVSIIMSSNETEEKESVVAIEQWLGYKERGPQVLCRETNRVRVMIFEEPSLRDIHFDLPRIYATQG